MAADQTTTQTLLPTQDQWLTDLYRRTVQQVDQGLPVYQGPRVAGFNPNQTAGQQATIDAAKGPMQQVINTGTQANTFWSDPNRVFDLSSVPGYSGVRQGIQNTVGRMLTEDWLPAITGGSIINSGLANNRLGLAQGEAIGRATEQLTSGLAGLDMNTAQMMMNANQAALNRTPQFATMQTMPGDIQQSVGGQQQAMEQAILDAQRQKFQEEANVPYQGLNELRATVGMYPGGVGQSSVNEADPGFWQTALSLGLLGKSLGLFGGPPRTTGPITPAPTTPIYTGSRPGFPA